MKCRLRSALVLGIMCGGAVAGFSGRATAAGDDADDQLVREKAGWLLGNAAASVEAAESNYRREFLPAPTRAKPFPDAAAVAAAQQLERLVKAIRALVNRMTELPVPGSDRMTQRYREEAPTLEALIALDTRKIVTLGTHPLVPFLANMQVERQRRG